MTSESLFIIIEQRIVYYT